MFTEDAARWEDGENGADDVGCCWEIEVAGVVLLDCQRPPPGIWDTDHLLLTIAITPSGFNK